MLQELQTSFHPAGSRSEDHHMRQRVTARMRIVTEHEVLHHHQERCNVREAGLS